MKKVLALVLVLACLAGLAGCSAPAEEGTAGAITFYSGPTHEQETPVAAATLDLTKEQAKTIQKALDGVENWVDDYLVDRLAYYFDGRFQFAGEETVYYFTYEYNVVYYDHYFADIGTETMEYIRSIGAGVVPAVEETPVERMVDRTVTEGIPTDQALEPFYEDGEYVYSFPSVRSEYVMVYYTDGTEQTVKEALAEGRIAVGDLDRFGISYYKEEKT